MHILDNLKKIKSLDQSDMLGSIDMFPRQVDQALTETAKLKIPADYKKVDKVVINGMGGSGLGTHVIRSVYFKKLKHTIGNIHSYDLPGVVDSKTLYIISSYSGNTEEPMGTIKFARARRAKLLGISSAGKLGEMIDKGDIPGYHFEPRYNLCNQPRIGICYSVAGLLGLLKQTGVISVKDAELKAAALHMKKLSAKFSFKKLFKQNEAKQVAEKMKGKVANVIASSFLSGNAHVMANQLNENAKNFSNYYIVSELNHHLMEGLANPSSNSKNLIFFFFESDLYNKQNQKRYTITKKILDQHKIDHVSYKLTGKNELEQAFEALLFGSYVAYYLGILNNIDPSPIPWVDYFKEELSK